MSDEELQQRLTMIEGGDPARLGASAAQQGAR